MRMCPSRNSTHRYNYIYRYAVCFDTSEGSTCPLAQLLTSGDLFLILVMVDRIMGLVPAREVMLRMPGCVQLVQHSCKKTSAMYSPWNGFKQANVLASQDGAPTTAAISSYPHCAILNP